MYTSLSDIKIDTIDFEWIKNQTKISFLKRAIRVIEQDGDYYKQLKDACYARMEEIDPTCKRIKFDNALTPDVQNEILNELQDWEKTVEKKQGGKTKIETNLEDYESYFDNDKNKISEKKKSQIAEKERIKGNQAIKSKDFDEAITYYTRSIELDSKMYQSYGNRALAYLKKKEFVKCIDDCESALSIDPNFAKAYHRKAKALVGLRRKVEAYRCFKQILKLQPQNSEINKQMKQLREQMTQAEISELQSSLIPKSEFKKITIEQDSDEEIEEN